MIFDNEMVNFALYTLVAIGALHVGSLAVFDYGLVADLLGASGTTETWIKGAIGVAGAINLVEIATELGDG